MAGINKVILLGHVGKDPEIRNTQAGEAVANIRLATSEKWKDKAGEYQERTEWHSVVIFGRLAETVEKYVRKGTQLYVEGQIQTRKWVDQSGAERLTTEIVVKGFGGTMQMIGGKSGGTSTERQETAPPRERETRGRPNRAPAKEPADEWSDIPF